MGMPDGAVRVLAMIEKVEKGLRAAIAGKRTPNTTLPSAIVAHHADVLSGACAELRMLDGEAPERRVRGRDQRAALMKAWDATRGVFVCPRCQCDVATRTGMHVDHVVPLARGGSNAVANLEAVCQACNLRKAA